MFFNSTGYRNSAGGESSLFNNTTGHSNSAFGDNSLYDNEVGNNRTALGYSANSTDVSDSNNTGLGNNADCSASNQIRIGNSSVTSIGGYVGWTNLSDGRFKMDVREDVVGLAFINALRPLTYQINLHALDNWWGENYRERDPYLETNGYEKEEMIYSGFVAQEVEMAAHALGYTFSGVDAPKNDKDFYGLRYAEFVVPLVKAVQELSAENQLLRDLISKQQAKLLSLESKVDALLR
jgi:hypothetical protein